MARDCFRTLRGFVEINIEPDLCICILQGGQKEMSQLRPPTTNYLNGGSLHDDGFLLENPGRPPPPPPAPPSTPVVKQASQKYHHQLLQQLPKMLANGINLSRPEDYMWLDSAGRPTTPPRAMSPQNKAQCTRKVSLNFSSAAHQNRISRQYRGRWQSC